MANIEKVKADNIREAAQKLNKAIGMLPADVFVQVETVDRQVIGHEYPRPHINIKVYKAI